MSYRDQAIQTYIETLQNGGLSGIMVKIMAAAFDTGFSAGSMVGEDESSKDDMIELLSETPTLN